jgi:hypothetical protein
MQLSILGGLQKRIVLAGYLIIRQHESLPMLSPRQYADVLPAAVGLE